MPIETRLDALHVNPAPVVDAHETNLASYLNQPVQDILDRLGVSPMPHGVADPPPPAAGTPATGNPATHGGGPTAGSPQGGSSPFDPTTLIQPVTDALGTLGSGQLGGGQDPSQILSGITQALTSVGESLPQALSSLGESWQGDAASAMHAATNSTLMRGSAVSSQADQLHASLVTAVADVAQAQTRLVEIIHQFAATITAIGPNIIFPWGMAAAINAANLAITSAVEVVTELQSSLSKEAGTVTTAGTPVPTGTTPTTTGILAVAAPSRAAAGGPGLLGSLSPLLGLGTSMASPAMEVVSTITSAAKGAGEDHPATTDHDEESTPAGGPPGPAAGGAAHPGGGGPGKLSSANPLRPATPNVNLGHPAPSSVAVAARSTAPGGGAPMFGGGGPMGQAAKSGVSSGHNPASFLHTSDQGGEILGDPGTVAPPVIGELDPRTRPTIDLRI